MLLFLLCLKLIYSGQSYILCECMCVSTERLCTEKKFDGIVNDVRHVSAKFFCRFSCFVIACEGISTAVKQILEM